MSINPLHAIDGYKAGHVFQYPKGTTMLYGNFTPRNAKYAKEVLGMDTDHMVFFGLQGFIKSFLIDAWNENFFGQSRAKVVRAYKRRVENMLGMPFDVDHIGDLHDLGYLPIEIRGLDEGTLVPMKVPVLTIQSTHPDFFWVSQYLETALSAGLWKCCTNATIAYELRRALEENAALTCDNNGLVPFQAHDFSFRGMSSIEDGAVNGAAHLASFIGTDTFPAVDFVEEYYGANSDKQMVGATVPGTEHSVMCAGTKEGELDTVLRLLDTYPTGIIAMVMDSWDFFKAIDEVLPSIKDKILARDGKLTVRPDSGDPADILCGTAIAYSKEEWEERQDWILQDHVYGSGSRAGRPIKVDGAYYWPEIIQVSADAVAYGEASGKPAYRVSEIKNPTPQMMGAVEVLGKHFGYTTNSKGYKELDSHIGLIYGDGITMQRLKEIQRRLALAGWAGNNVLFGIGSFTYNGMQTRDTFGMAMKATYAEIDGKKISLQKDPVTDDGTKKSATGLINVYRVHETGELVALDAQDKLDPDSLLKPVFRDGKLLRETTLSEIRKRLWNWDDAIPGMK